jgi:hypothetical protein
MSHDDSAQGDSASAATNYELFGLFLSVVTLVLGVGGILVLAEEYVTQTLALSEVMWVLAGMYLTHL